MKWLSVERLKVMAFGVTLMVDDGLVLGVLLGRFGVGIGPRKEE